MALMNATCDMNPFVFIIRVLDHSFAMPTSYIMEHILLIFGLIGAISYDPSL